jgi:hypothetical protein
MSKIGLTREPILNELSDASRVKKFNFDFIPPHFFTTPIKQA